jgi:iron complex outermembrane receptor protein
MHNYIAGLSRFETDGYRDHSAGAPRPAECEGEDGIGRRAIDARRERPGPARDPGPAGAHARAVGGQSGAGRCVGHALQYPQEHQPGAGRRGSTTSTWPAGRGAPRAYAGDRQITQYLGQTGDTPLGLGGVVDLDRQYGGVGVARFVHVRSATGRSP